jgi:hypothetical protein
MLAILRLDFTCIASNIGMLVSGPANSSATTLKFTRSDMLDPSLRKTIRQPFPEVKLCLAANFHLDAAELPL